MCEDDIFTDRWPESIGQQNEFAIHLKEIVEGIEEICSGKMSANAIAEWMRERFGSRIFTKAADRMGRQIGAAVQSSSQNYSRKGKLLIPAATRTLSATAASLANPGAAARAHSFYGGII
jgi:3-polyprenyl-4-hydroxybenzoate decarboxylase